MSSLQVHERYLSVVRETPRLQHATETMVSFKHASVFNNNKDLGGTDWCNADVVCTGRVYLF